MGYQEFINSVTDAVETPAPTERATRIIALLRTGLETIYANALLLTQHLVDKNSELPREIDAPLMEIKHIADSILASEISLLDILEKTLAETSSSPKSPTEPETPGSEALKGG